MPPLNIVEKRYVAGSLCCIFISRYGSGKYEIEKCRFLIVCLTFGLKLFRFDVSKLASLIFDPYLKVSKKVHHCEILHKITIIL